MYNIYKALKVAAVGGLVGASSFAVAHFAPVEYNATTDTNQSVLTNVTNNLSSLFHIRDECGGNENTTTLEIPWYVAKAKALPTASVIADNTAHERQTKLQKRNEIMKFGYPTLDNIIQYEDHILAYSNIHKAPLWVCEHLTEYNVNNQDQDVTRGQSKFHADTSVHPLFRAQNKDYLNSGYDRGHLAAAGNHRQSQTAMNDTFYLSNICPQMGKGLNRTKWNKLEKRGRALARKYNSVHVLTGPLFLPTVIGNEKFIKYKLMGDNNVAVPTHFFKAVLARSSKGGYHLECYVMPNEEIRNDLPISSFLVPKIAIEKGAGFFVFEFVADSQYRTINGNPNPAFIP